MGKINLNRVLVGGLLAGVVLNVIDYVFWGIVFADDINAALAALNKPAMDMSQVWWFVLLDFAYGIFLVWLYAAIRPRFGPGPKTAVYAGLTVWVLAGLLHALSEAPMQLFPTRMMVIGTLVMLVAIPLAAVAGAKIYQES
jgi:hypothetical protein